jgi:hypothetical protein
MTQADYAALEFAGWFQTVNGFALMNASRPQTIAAALSDSPVGHLAYNELFENFGNGTSLLSRDQVLTQVSLYWLTNTSSGAVRYYFEERAAEAGVNDGSIGSPCSPTTSCQCDRSPSATTPTSCRGLSVRRVATSPPWRSPTPSPRKFARSSRRVAAPRNHRSAPDSPLVTLSWATLRSIAGGPP